MLYVNGRKYNFVGGGHSIKNDTGTALAQKDNLKFVGTYSTNTSTDTVVNVTRSMTTQEFNLLSEEEKKGVIDVTDEYGNDLVAEDIGYDNTSSNLSSTNVQDAIDELDTKAMKEVTAAQFETETDQGMYFITDLAETAVSAEQVAYGSGNVKQALEEQPTDISDKFVLNTDQFSSLSGTCKAFYDKKTKRVWGTLSAGANENIGQTQAYFTIASEYRPSADVTNIPMQVKLSDDRISCYFGRITTTDGQVRQDLTSASKGIYAYFEYYL